MSRVGAIILSAGASTRLGRPKQLVRMGQENLLERSVRVAREADCSPVVVVLGASGELIRDHSNLSGAEIVFNDGWQEGIASSIRHGIQALPDVDGVVLMVCDMPAVTPSHIRALAASGRVTGTAYAGKRGVPAYMPMRVFPSLLKLQGDTGARDLLRNAPSIELAGGELDVDTEQDVRFAEELFGGFRASNLRETRVRRENNNHN